jgi:pimeloyl-ACP methyl ester carboxylesterase
MPFFDADDAAIYYEIEGDGPPLVLLHGYALNGRMWEYQAPVFSKSHEVITVDLRGFGKSSCGKAWSGAIMAGDIIGLMSSLNLKNIAVLGFSMGGPVAVRIAYLLPEVVIKLILESSILPSRGLPKTKEEERRNGKELEILKSRGVDGWAESMSMWRGQLVGDMLKDNPELESMWRKLISMHDISYLSCMMTARLTTESGTDWRSRLKKIQQKTLIIAGANDKNFVDASKRLAQDIPNSEMVIIEGAGHMVNLERPEEFNRAVLGFLGKEKN